MTPVSEVLKNTFDSARAQLAVVEKGVDKLEKKAKASFGEMKAQFEAAPKKLEGAWGRFVKQIKPDTWTFATRAELHALAGKVDELAGKVEKLAQGRKKANA